MSNNAASEAPHFKFTSDSSASPFKVTQQAYLNSYGNAKYSYIATGAIVFDVTEPSNLRVLLLQRSASDSMPNCWEVPGGGVDDDDESILHAAARELWEEAGLKVRYISAPIGDPQLFTSRSGKQICKFHFVVQAETDAEGHLKPRLDPKEHQKFKWANESQVRLKKVDDIQLEFTHKEVEDAVLLAFDQLKKTGERRM